MNLFQKAAAEQAAFTGLMSENGYKTISTFFSDLTIADAYGESAVIDTIVNVNRTWRGNTEMYSEFIVCLNHKIWQHYEAGNFQLAKVYDKYWRKYSKWVEENWSEEQLRYYYKVTD